MPALRISIFFNKISFTPNQFETVILTVADTVAPSAVVAVTVTVDGPVGVGVGPDFAVVHPTRAPAARTSNTSPRYTGARRKGSVRCRTAPNIPSMDSRTAATSHSM
jgi:hypothetical protein